MNYPLPDDHPMHPRNQLAAGQVWVSSTNAEGEVVYAVIEAGAEAPAPDAALDEQS